MKPAWELTVRLVSWPSTPDAPAVAVGAVSGGELPIRPTTVVARARDSVAIVHGAQRPVPGTMWTAPGLHAFLMPGVHVAALPPGSRIAPLGEGEVDEQAPTRAFTNRLARTTGERVALAPDYGGVLFRTAWGMAPIGAFEHRITAELQHDVWMWYQEWDESTTTDRWTEAEWEAEGQRLAIALNQQLSPECEFFRDVKPW